MLFADNSLHYAQSTCRLKGEGLNWAGGFGPGGVWRTYIRGVLMSDIPEFSRLLFVTIDVKLFSSKMYYKVVLPGERNEHNLFLLSSALESENRSNAPNDLVNGFSHGFRRRLLRYVLHYQRLVLSDQNQTAFSLR